MPSAIMSYIQMVVIFSDHPLNIQDGPKIEAHFFILMMVNQQ